MWAAGDRVSVIGKDLAVSDLTAPHPQTIIKTMALIGMSFPLSSSLRHAILSLRHIVIPFFTCRHSMIFRRCHSFRHFVLPGNQVWAIKGKSLLVFDAEKRELIKESTDTTFGEVLLMSSSPASISHGPHFARCIRF